MLSLLKSLKCIYMMGEECWGRETKYKNDIWYLIPIIKIVLICPFIVTCSYTLLQSTELVFSSLVSSSILSSLVKYCVQGRVRTSLLLGFQTLLPHPTL